MKNKKKVLKGIVIGICIVVVLWLLVVGVYIATYYHADAVMLKDLSEELKATNCTYTVSVGENKELILVPDNIKAGIIFYPGGKVQSEAYYPLMKELAKDGYLCILLKVTGNLAVLDMNAADGYVEKYPEVNDWYIGGHSLGGVVASMYADKHSGVFDGVILLGSYSTEDLNGDVDEVLCLYGSNDQVLNIEKYEENKDNLPNLTEYEIEGGCHAFFGAYGEQKGDGIPSITRQKQIEITASCIDEFILED